MNKKNKNDVVDIISYIETLFVRAYNDKASDIHIDPSPEGLIVRLRIDGMLRLIDTLAIELQEELITRIKILANLRTDIHFVPQDGRFDVSPSPIVKIDVRVSIIPTYYGENAVMRILLDKNIENDFLTLGFSEADKNKIEKGLSNSSGMILVSAPTGQGTTSTLYTMVQKLAKKETSIITLEDPIDYAIAGVRQVQIKEKHGITFANGLRSIIRQDPDVIMVSEIRDSETAQIAVNISLTGHLLISSIHSNSALGVIARLIEKEVDSYLVASTLSTIVAQRLVRKLCKECKGIKCPHCGQTGYKGRTLIGEVLTIDDEMRKFIMCRVSFSELARYARSTGFTTMYEDGMQKVEDGITTKEEVLRVLHE